MDWAREQRSAKSEREALRPEECKFSSTGPVLLCALISLVGAAAGEVLNVDGGLIAIPAKAGENEITLTLTPKWLPLSCGLTAAGALLYAGFRALTLLRRHRQGPLPGRFVPLEVAAGHPSALWDGAEESEQLLLAEDEAPGGEDRPAQAPPPPEPPRESE